MKNYLKLNLPANPVRDVAALQKRVIRGGYNLTYPKNVLTDEIMNIFSQMGLRPKFVSLFGRNDSNGKIETRMIHADIALNENKQWKKLLFGINWEVTGHHNIFSWWDMTNVPEIWPGDELAAEQYNYLNGIHYGSRFKLGVPDGAKKIDEVLIDKPTLVRTELPHMTVYKGSNLGNRVGVSVRFHEDDFSSWEDVYKFFEKYSINE